MEKLPQASVALQTRLIVRSCGHVPATLVCVNVIVTFGSQLSIPVAVPVVAGRVLDVQLIVMLGGQLITGTTLSSITIN